MGKFIDLIGRRYGNWSVIERNDSRCGKIYWLCECACGKIKNVSGANLHSGKSMQCACCGHTKHGLSTNGIYYSWRGMIRRCYNATDRSYPNYGGRNITVCNEWRQFDIFVRWAVANGFKNGLTIDRINVNGNYEPHNCRWITRAEQQRNKRCTRTATINGITKRLIEWAEISGTPYVLIHQRIYRSGWSPMRAIFTPSGPNNSIHVQILSV